MGEVYCATDAVLGRAVAIKLLDPRLAGDEMVRRRFRREALTAARVSSEPGIVTIFDVGECAGRPFIVMEYLPGGSLQDVLERGGAQPPTTVLRWLEEAAEALDRANEQGVVHRDVKPANLLLDRDGGVHVADFGVAAAAGLESLTQTGTLIGTAGYLSPEQAEGRPATSASDRYALAVVAFELLAGSRPFESRTVAAEAAAHVATPVPAISERRRGLPPELDAVFARALAKDPSRRFPTGRAFVDALRDAFAEGGGADARRHRVAPPVRRRRRVLLPLALVLLLGAGAFAAVLATTRGGGSPAATRSRSPDTGTTVRQTVTSAPATTTRRAARRPRPAAPTRPRRATRGCRRATTPAPSRSSSRPPATLRGSRSLDEAYNDYNLAFTLAKTQGCSQDVLRLLDASQAIQGRRAPIDELRKACSR